MRLLPYVSTNCIKFKGSVSASQPFGSPSIALIIAGSLRRRKVP